MQVYSASSGELLLYWSLTCRAITDGFSTHGINWCVSDSMAIYSTQPMANLLAKPMANWGVNVVNVMFHPSKPYKSHQLDAWVVGITKNVEKPLTTICPANLVDPFHSRTHLGPVIYVHEWLTLRVNVGKYTSRMDPMLGCPRKL